jgi:hypothetical protein
MISEEPNASLSPRHGSRVQQNIPSRRAKNPSGNSTPQKISPLRNRRRHIPTDEFPDQLNRHHTIKPSVRHLVNRTASIPRHVILPSKQVRSSRVAPTSVAKTADRTCGRNRYHFRWSQNLFDPIQRFSRRAPH